MNKVLTLVIVLCLCILDLAITTIIYCHGNKFGTVFSHSLNAYVYSTSLLELWCFVIIRTSVILGLIIGIIVNTDTGVLRVKSGQLIATYCICISCMYTIIKLLVLAEKLDNLNSIWVKGLFAWSLGAAVLFIIQWKLLGKINSPRLLHLNVNCDESEAKPLLCDRNPNDSNKNGKEKKADMFSRSTVLRLVALSKPDWLWILTGFTFLSLASAGEIFVPFFTGKVVDGIVIDKSEKEFSKAVIIMALISAGSAIAAGIRGGCLFIVIERLNIRIRNLLFSSILRQEIGFFDTMQSGEITSRLTSDTTTMSDALGLNINIFLRNLIKAVGVLFFMIKLSWRLTMVTVIGLPCILTVSSVYGKYYKKLAEQVQDSLAEANNVAEEACSSMRTVRSFANEQGEVNRYADKLGVTYKLNKKQAVMYSGFVWCSNLFELALTVSVLYYGGHLVIKGTLTGGRLISFILYQIQLGSCVSEMGNVYTGLMEAAGASEKVFSYIDRKPKIIPTGKLAPETINGRIEFKNVNFNYPSRPDVPVLKDMNLTVSPGEVVALVGPSGGGKTSCVNLLEHFYAALSGEVLVDNVPIHEYDHHFIHKQISLVGQEPILYARTIEENIRYGLEEGEWSQDEIMVASQMANAHRFIMEMKDGYNTQTGEKGVQMSGGQKQRVAIARALIRKPKVLLLDEATSALDAESEFLVQQALYQNMSGRTVIIIAHRLSTVERADRILVIDKGTVVEQGTHQQLLEKKGLYTSLVKRQMLISESSYNDLRTAQMSECSCGRRRRVSSSGRHNSGNKPTLERENSMPRAIFIVGSA